jgi:hypothetical protein
MGEGKAAMGRETHDRELQAQAALTNGPLA